MLIGFIGQLLHAFSFAFTFAFVLVKSFTFAFLALLPFPFLLVTGSAVFAEMIRHTALVTLLLLVVSMSSSFVCIAVVRRHARAFSFTRRSSSPRLLDPAISALVSKFATEVTLAVKLLGHGSNVHR